MNKKNALFASNNYTDTRFDIFFKKFINFLMIDGKKIKASKIFFNTVRILKKKIKNELERKTSSIPKDLSLDFTVLHVILKAFDNLMPSVEIRKVRVAGSTYLVPAIISKKKQETLALKWLIDSAKKRQKNAKFDFSTCLADEILDASRKLGQARQKRDELHRLAQINRAYMRYRWW